MPKTKVEISINVTSGSLTTALCNINGDMWDMTGGFEGEVDNVDVGIGYMYWFVRGAPGSVFEFTLKNAKRDFDGQPTFSRKIPNSLSLASKVEKIVVKEE